MLSDIGLLLVLQGSGNISLVFDVIKIAVLRTTILLKTSKDRHLQTHPFF